RQLIRQEIPVMIGAAVLLLVLVLDRSLDRLDGALLTLLTGAYLSFLVWQSRRDRPAARTAPQGGTVPRADTLADTVADTGADTGAQTGHARPTHEAVPAPPQRSAARLAVQLLLIAAGLVCLVFGAR